MHRNTALGSEGRSEPAFVCGDVCVCGWVFWVEGIALNIISGRFKKKSRLRMEIFYAIRVYFLRESQAHEPSS